MKKNYLNLNSCFIALFIALLGNGWLNAQVTTQTFSYTGAMQTFTVPVLCVNTVTIDARGAGGGSVSTSCVGNGGLGARMVGTFTVTAGQVFSIMVGQTGYSNGSDAGGGGGSFVSTGTVPLIVAGGGGGASNNVASCGSNLNGVNASTTTAGTYNASNITAGGTGGNGGGATGGSGGGGGGFYTNGTAGSGNASGNGKAFLLGGAGGVGLNNNHGGYGGGGCGWHTGGNGGGGGGYSGGGTYGASPYSGGGGGGSFNAGISQTNTAGYQAGNGLIIITYNLGTPVTTAATSTALCAGGSATLSAGAMQSYTWSTGSNNTSITVSPSSTTSYTVQGTNSQNCISSAIITVTVSSGLPSLAITSSTNQTCLGKTVTLTATGALTYSWTGGISNGVSFSPTSTNSYTVTGQNGCGTSTAVTTVTVAPLAVSMISSPTVVCAGQTSTLVSVSAGTSFTWFPVTTNASSIVVSPTANTVYTVAVTDGTCSGTGTVAVAANPIPTITSSSSSTLICAGQVVTLTANGGLSYSWTPVNLAGSTITVSPTAPIQYFVSGSNSFGCFASSSQVIIVTPSPTVNTTVSDALICNGGSSSLTVSGNATGYVWDSGSTSTMIVVSPTVSTTYTVIGNSSNGCASTNTVEVDVFNPSITVTGTTTICDGGTAYLQASGASSYTWNPGASPFQNISVTPAASTIYTVSAFATSVNISCTATNTLQVTVNPNPTITAVSSRSTICRNETTTITANGGTNYSWTLNSSTTAIASTASVLVTSSLITTLNYSVTGSFTTGCKSTLQVQVKVNGCNGIEEFGRNAEVTVYPNPNNGDFSVRAEEELSIAIINQLGQVVRTVNLNAENNYNAQVNSLPQGVYFVSGQKNNQIINKKVIIQN